MPENVNVPLGSPETDLLSEKNLLSDALKLAKVGYWEVNIAAERLLWSERVYRMHEIEVGTKVSLEAAIGFYKEEHRQTIEKAVSDAQSNGTPWDLECLLLTSSGRETWVRTIGEAVFQDGKPLKIRGLIQDINERKVQERALAEQEFRYRSMLDHTFNFIGLLDPDGTILEANTTALDFGGFTLEQARGQNFADAPWWSTSEEINQQVREALEKARQGSFVRYDAEVTGVDRTMHIDFSISPVRGKDGQVQFLVPDARDISDRQETEQRLKKSLDQYRRFVTFAPAAVAMFDRDMNYIAASSKWAKDYNLANVDLIGKCHYEIFPEILEMPKWLDDHQRVLAGEKYQSEKDKFVRHDGTVQWLKYTLLPWYEDSETIGGLTMYTADITNEILYQEKLAALNQTLETEVQLRTQELVRLNKDLEQFVYIASHDLQEPLRAIANYLSLIKMDGMSDQNAHAMDRIHLSTERMSSLVAGLLDYSLLGKSPSHEEIDLNHLVGEVLEDFNKPIEEKQATITVDHLPTIIAAPSDMRQLFENLIGNGLKYQRPDHTPSIQVTCKEQENDWAFAVADNGIGIKEEYQAKIFKIFTRLHTRDEYPGTGIGLAMCHRIIDGYEGTIRIESTLGHGSTFHFTLPKTLDEA
ncbi:MAG: PAS domain S-box protein [Mariniblastus sp.]